VDGVQVPQNYIQNGEIVLNISNTAVRNLQVDNLFLEFDGRFGGNPITVVIPVGAVVAVYAKETGDGMVFEVESKELRTAEETESPGSHLRLVK
jgi:stringent starvation protein B